MLRLLPMAAAKGTPALVSRRDADMENFRSFRSPFCPARIIRSSSHLGWRDSVLAPGGRLLVRLVVVVVQACVLVAVRCDGTRLHDNVHRMSCSCTEFAGRTMW